MTNYLKKLPSEPSFKNKDFFEGYILNSKNPEIEMDYINMFKGHEYYQLETESIHLFYILEGEGIASIGGKRFNVGKGDIIEIPVNTEYVFAGKFKMIEIMQPAFNAKTHRDTKLNDLI